MKKFLITLLILIIIGGTVFFFGWAQLTVPPGSYGIISSKTHGVDPQPVRSGEFRWIWYKLIPTNVKISVFTLEPAKFNLDFSSSLPSGSTYASFAGLGNLEFSWSMKGEISFSFNPDMLYSAVSARNLADQNDFNAYIDEIGQEIKIIILRNLSAIESDSQRLQRILSGNTDTIMENEIKRRFPEINDLSFLISSANYPDFLLYDMVRSLYEEYLRAQREEVASSFAAMAERHIETQMRFTELERYGELLDKFPSLFDFITLSIESGIW